MNNTLKSHMCSFVSALVGMEAVMSFNNCCHVSTYLAWRELEKCCSKCLFWITLSYSVMLVKTRQSVQKLKNTRTYRRDFDDDDDSVQHWLLIVVVLLLKMMVSVVSIFLYYIILYYIIGYYIILYCINRYSLSLQLQFSSSLPTESDLRVLLRRKNRGREKTEVSPSATSIC